MPVRNLLTQRKHKNYSFKSKNLLELCILNQGIKDIFVNGQYTLKPNEHFFISGNCGIILENDTEFTIEVTGSDKEENNVLISLTSLKENVC